MTNWRRRFAFPAALVLWIGCGGQGDQGEESGVSMPDRTLPEVLATNAFYYYSDVDGAWDFYTRILGFETVADYGFAKILQVAPTSFLTLVDEARGMHDSAEPKSVTLAVVTEEVEAWWEYLNAAGVEMRAELGEVEEGKAHDGFVAIDPEGYLLEFERFNPHPENTELMPVLDQVQAIYPSPGQEMAPGVTTTRPENLGVQGTVLWLYYRDLQTIEAFYSRVFGRGIIVDQGWAKVFPVSASGFVGFVDGERGLHSATDDKAVTVSFFTEGVEEWFEAAKALPDFPLRTTELSAEGDFVTTFVGYDPEGYYLEWDTFLDVPENEKLLERLGGSR